MNFLYIIQIAAMQVFMGRKRAKNYAAKRREEYYDTFLRQPGAEVPELHRGSASLVQALFIIGLFALLIVPVFFIRPLYDAVIGFEPAVTTERVWLSNGAEYAFILFLYPVLIILYMWLHGVLVLLVPQYRRYVVASEIRNLHTMFDPSLPQKMSKEERTALLIRFHEQYDTDAIAVSRWKRLLLLPLVLVFALPAYWLGNGLSLEVRQDGLYEFAPWRSEPQVYSWNELTSADIGLEMSNPNVSDTEAHVEPVLRLYFDDGKEVNVWKDIYDKPEKIIAACEIVKANSEASFYSVGSGISLAALRDEIQANVRSILESEACSPEIDFGLEDFEFDFDFDLTP